jgi:hypothetical protein
LISRHGDDPVRADPLLKPATFWDAVIIEIPRSWTCVVGPDGMWECYESDDKELETIWVSYDVFRLPDGGGQSEAAFLSQVAAAAESIGTPPANQTASRKVIPVSPAHTAVNASWTSISQDDGAEIYNSVWHHIGALRPFCIVVHLKMVAPSAWLADKGYAALAQSLDQGLMNAGINWARLQEA